MTPDISLSQRALQSEHMKSYILKPTPTRWVREKQYKEILVYLEEQS